MAKNSNDVRLSPRESRLYKTMKPGQWIGTMDLISSEFKGKKRPVNARLLVTASMWRMMQKLGGTKGLPKVEKRGGGRGGTEYMLVTR